MRVELRDFRCHAQANLDFPAGVVSLLTGPNGAGKTSVGLAVCWCLFGKVLHVDPQVHGRSKTRVRLTFDGLWVVNRLKASRLEVTRTRNPSALTFVVVRENAADAVSTPASQALDKLPPREELSGKEAQARVDELFGPEVVWGAAGYLEQKGRCAFLQQGIDRLRVLTWLCFRDQDPERFASRADELLKEQTKVYQGALAAYEAQAALYKDLVRKFGIAVDAAAAPPPEPAGLPTADRLRELIRAADELAREEVSARSRAKEEARLSAEEERLAQEEAKFSVEEAKMRSEAELHLGPGELITEDDPALRSRISAAEAEERVLGGRVSQLVDFLALVERHGFGPPWEGREPTWDSVAASRRAWDAQVAAAAALSGLLHRQVSASDMRSTALVEELRGEVASRLAYLEGCLGVQERLAAAARRAQLAAEVDPSFPSLPEAEKEVKARKTALRELKRRSDVLTCPGCRAPLVLSSGKLEPSARQAADPEELAAASSAVEESLRVWLASTTQAKLLGELAAAEQALARCAVPKAEAAAEFPLLQPAEAKALRQEKKKLEALEIKVTPPGSPEAASARLRWLEEARAIRSTWGQISGSVSGAEQEDAGASQEEAVRMADAAREALAVCSCSLRGLRKLGRAREQLASIRAQLAQVRSRLAELVSSGGPPLNFAEEQAELRREIEELKALAQREKLADLARASYGRLAELDAQAAAAEERYAGLLSLKAVIGKIWSLTLEMTLRELNDRAAEVLASLFAEPVEARFALAELQAGKQIELRVSYRGREYEGLAGLSGGEGDRISLAVTLALAYVLQPPVVVLDESLSYMDAETKTAAMQAVGFFSAAAGSSIISIQQDSGSLSYDRVVDLEKEAEGEQH